jgi:hypothetical protein
MGTLLFDPCVVHDVGLLSWSETVNIFYLTQLRTKERLFRVFLLRSSEIASAVISNAQDTVSACEMCLHVCSFYGTCGVALK